MTETISVGTPYVKDAAVTAQVVSHLRGDKIKVFKKKRRKGYQVLNGHRQYFTELMIEEIIESGFVRKEPKPKKAAEPKVKAEETCRLKTNMTAAAKAVSGEKPVKISRSKKTAEPKAAELKKQNRQLKKLSQKGNGRKGKTGRKKTGCQK